MNISEWQWIFRSGKTYFVVEMYISEWQDIFRSGTAYFGVAIHISEWQYIYKLELVYLPKGKYCVYPRMVYRMAIVMIPPPLLDDRKWIVIAFLAIPDQYATFTFLNLFIKWLPAAILDDRKSLSIAFLGLSDQYATLFFSQNGCHRPFWMTENQYWSHFFAISDQFSTLIFYFHKMAAGGHFGWPKITFERISRHFRSIHNFFFFSKWPPAAILEVRFAPKTIGFFHYVLSMAMPNMKMIGEFMTQLEMPQLFEHFYTKWPPEAILFFRLMPKIIGFL